MGRTQKPLQLKWDRGKNGVFHYFVSGYRARATLVVKPAELQYTYSRRHKELDAFLAKHRNEIKVFAEVGAANAKGAPTAFDAKQALGEDSKVYAVDIVELPKDSNPKKEVKPLLHSIVKNPLPFTCDAIRFSNVSMYLSESDSRRALVNIWKSLRVGGYLLGSDVLKFALRKTERGFELVERIRATQ